MYVIAGVGFCQGDGGGPDLVNGCVARDCALVVERLGYFCYRMFYGREVKD